MAAKRGLRNIHPGEVLREEFVKPLGLTSYRLAKEIHVPLTRVAELLHERRSITADTALRLSRFFGTTAKFWLGLQEDFDLEMQSRGKVRDLSRIHPFRAA